MSRKQVAATCPLCGFRGEARHYPNDGADDPIPDGWYMTGHYNPKGDDCCVFFEGRVYPATLADCIAALEKLEAMLSE
jgi:hypothetical protein